MSCYGPRFRRRSHPLQMAKLESLIRTLHDIEDQINTLDDADVLARRRSLSRHIMNQIAEYLDVRAYLDDVLRRALAGQTNWGEMTPQAWKASHLKAVRRYRQEERRQSADRNRNRQARRHLSSKSSGRR